VTRAKSLTAALAAATLALSGCGFHGLYSANLPGGADVGSNPYTVTIYFADVLDLVPQSAVKVNDVAVGKVENIRLSNAGDTDSGDPRTNGWTARVTVTVNNTVRLPANARAEVKMTSLLGEKYVALEAPDQQPDTTDLHDGSTIPITRTGSAPEAEEVLGALSLLLNGGGLQQIKVITTELNKALNGNEGAVRDLLDQLNTFVGTLDKQKNDITSALDSIDALAATLNAQKQTIVAALDTFPQALQVLNTERGKLVGLLSSLSDFGAVASRVVTETQSDLVGSLKSLAPVLEQLTAAGSDLPQSLKVALTFPFPVGATQTLVKGDYANLHLFLNFDLGDELCGLNAALCTLKSVGLSNSQSPVTTQSGAAEPVRQPSALQPSLIGAGG
jgi:phospholipid/cholesterol/gamma-HCH transport system substrate-binding protein